MIRVANHCHYFKSAARELIESIKTIDLPESWRINCDDLGATLCHETSGNNLCYQHSFADAEWLKRAQQKNQAVLKACNNKKRSVKTVLDTTAGWGRDAFILASHGMEVSLIEQHPLLYAILRFSKACSQIEESPAQAVMSRIKLIHANSLDYLQHKDRGVADCIYLDPMFPNHKSTAKPAKELQLLQLLTDNLDIEELMAVALQKAAMRVVVKRPLHAPALGNLKADLVYKEKSVRFDVYLIN